MFALRYSLTFLDRKKFDSLLEKFEKNESISVNTSGSTGQPKEIFFKSLQLINSAKITNAFFELNADSKALLCLSIDTIAGKMMLTRALVGDYQLSVTEPRSRPLKEVTASIDFVAMVPAQLSESIDHDLEKLKSIRVVLIGGGPISPLLEKKLKDKDITVYHSYGMTETVSHIALRRVGKETDVHFTGLKGVTFKTINDQLSISAEHLGIVDMPTNDVVHLLSESTFIWLGRADFVVNSGGKKIQLEEVEAKMSVHFNFPFFLWKEAHDKWGETLILVIKKETDLEKIDLTNLGLSKTEQAKKIYVFNDFLYSSSGKILRKATFEQIPNSVHE
jgi:O-succinylbenzoic acid--CoA ligase